MPLDWFGDKVSKRLRAAQIVAVNATMAQAVLHARRNHPWRNRTATLEGSIGIALPAAEVPGGVRGTWGSQDVAYALIHELGGVIRPVRAKALKFRLADGTFIQTQSVTIPPRPYLRPAADAEYPNLAARIRRAFERRAGAPGGG